MTLTGMDAGARGWLVTTAAANFWRVSEWYEFDDLIQDGVMVWYHVVQKYEGDTGRIRLRPHLMALFKRSYINHIHRLAIETNVQRVEVKAEDVVRGPGEITTPSFDHHEIWDALGLSRNVAEYELLIANAPKPLQFVLRRLLSVKPSATWASRCRIYADGTRTTLNDKLCRMIGVDPTRVDIATPLRSYLSR